MENNNGFIEMKSNTQFFEICSKKKFKLEVQISPTIVFEKGNPKLWLFNSQKEKSFEILKKNTEKTNVLKMIKFLCGWEHLEDVRLDSIQGYLEYMKVNKLENVES